MHQNIISTISNPSLVYNTRMMQLHRQDVCSHDTAKIKALTYYLHVNYYYADLGTEMDMSQVHPWIGSGWVTIFYIFLGWVGTKRQISIFSFSLDCQM